MEPPFVFARILTPPGKSPKTTVSPLERFLTLVFNGCDLTNVKLVTVGPLVVLAWVGCGVEGGGVTGWGVLG